MLSLLRRKAFCLVWTAGLGADAASWLLITGLPIYVFGLTDSSFVTSTVLIVELAAGISCGSFAGVLVDRLDRFRLMTAVTALQAGALVPLLFVRSAHQLWIIYLVAAAEAILTQTYEPAKNTLLPSLVGTDETVRANSMVAFNTNLGRLVGSSLSGFALAHGGTRFLCVGSGVCFLAAGALLHLGRRASGPAAQVSARQGTSAVGAWREGIRLVRADRDIRVAFLSTATWSVSQGMFVVLFVVFVSRVLGDSADVTGVLRGVQAIGGLMGGVFIATLGHRAEPRRLMIIGATSFGLLSLVLWNTAYVTHSEAVYIALFIAVGIPGIASNSGVFSLVQGRVANGELGRVFSIFYMVNNSFQCLGMLVGGLLGDRVNVTFVLDGQAALYLVAAAISLTGLRAGGERHRSAHAPAERLQPTLKRE